MIEARIFNEPECAVSQRVEKQTGRAGSQAQADLHESLDSGLSLSLVRDRRPFI